WIHGWYHVFRRDQSTQPVLKLEGVGELTAINQFHVAREDVQRAIESADPFHGVVFEFLVPGDAPESRIWKVYWNSECVLSADDTLPLQFPPYPYLINDERVFHRDWIYCSGLPVDYLNPEVLALAKSLPGPVLDFGCGTGVMTVAMREFGVDVKGLELDRPEIRKAMPQDRLDFIDWYDGSLPLPYETGAFESVIISEVLEHLEEPEPVMEEITRVCKNQILVTVPDLCGVPLNHRHGVVPWHLLESTHVNFFNPTSLEAFLRNWFPKVELYRISRNETNGTLWWGGLMALAQK
ncbi:MAG: class I SAM-dependent methyltransferase, partial [Cyanothece sp. SIO1E1]|nr:class I SAM-dependent methyltransferase [Cyanothece sp. SIO1E1]